MRKIRWTILAKEDYFSNIEFLISRWSEKEAQNFIDKVNEVEKILASGSFEFQETNIPGVHRCVIIPQIVLFYQVHSNQLIEFLRFWNVFQDNRKNRFE